MNYSKINYYITGASSYVASNLLKILLSNNLNIKILTKSKNKFRHLQNKSNVELIYFDLNKRIFPVKAKKNSILFHFAWDYISDYNSVLHIENNYINSYSFLNDAINKNIKNVYVAGTCFEYGNYEGEITVENNCKPNNFYAISKYLLLQKLLLLQSNKNFNLKWFRIFYPYGIDAPKGIISHLKKSIISKKRFFDIVSDKHSRDFVDVKDAANQIYQISLNETHQTIYNICSGKPTKIINLLDQIIRENNFKISLRAGKFKQTGEESISFWGKKNHDF